MPLPFGFSSLSIRSMVSYVGAAVAVTRSALTYSEGVMRKNTAPHSVKPSPMKAKTCEFARIAKPSASIPGVSRAMPMAIVRVNLIRMVLVFTLCSSRICRSACTFRMVGCSKVAWAVFVAVSSSAVIYFEIIRFAFKVSLCSIACLDH